MNTFVAIFALAFKATCRVYAFGRFIAVVCTCHAFINVNAVSFRTITFIAVLTFTSITRLGVGTLSVDIASMFSSFTLVYIIAFALCAISMEAWLALTAERAFYI